MRMHEQGKKLKDEYARRINRAINYISKHYGKALPLNELAAYACFSPFHFHRIFHSLTGETLGGYIRRIRLERAVRQLIFDREKSITAIALECGFSSSQNFAKAFRNHFGISPSEVRKLHDFRDPDFYEKSKPGNIRRKLGKDLLADAVYSGSTDRATIRINAGRSGTMKVEVKEMDAMRVAYFRGIGPYAPATIGPLFEKLMAWAGPRGLCNAKSLIMGASWDDPGVTPEDKCRYDACITVPDDFRGDDKISLQSLPAGKYAVMRCEVRNDEFEKPWTELMRDWLPASGYQPDDKPCLEIYYNDASTDPEKRWIMDICLPVKPL